MTDQAAEEVVQIDPVPLTSSQLFLRRSAFGNSKLPATHISANQADDRSESESSGEDNELNSPLQQFLQASTSDFRESINSKQTTSEGTLSSTLPVKHHYSMEADMIFGWRPKYIPQVPVPLKFTSSMLEDIVQAFLDSSGKQKYPELIYQGFRPDNTFFMHEKLSTTEAYNIKFSSFAMAKHTVFCKISGDGPINPPRPFLGMKKDVRQDCLVFDSIFEHGNLDTVIRKAANEYDLFLRVDSNTKGHTSWYYFTVKNMQKGQKVRFNILNLSKATSLYQRGMKPYVHSKRAFEEQKIDWTQSGEDITYKPSFISYFGETFQEPSRKKYSKMSFEYTFEYEDDTVSFALCVPYSYGRLVQFIQGLIETQKSSGEGTYLTTSKLCFSLGGISIPLLTITDPDDPEFPMEKRQYIVCTGRVHPGEPNSSWMIQGFIDELCKDKPESQYLRKKFVFKIIPMLNPDGVITGNHRTGMCGNDLNRQFVTPKEVLHPNLIALKDMVRELISDKKDVFAYMDFHGHSLKKNVFTYGAEFPVYDQNYYRVKILPKLIARRNPMFRFQSCLFTVSKPKLTTARAVFSMHYGVSHFYTLEASYANYINADRETIPFDANGFMSMGISVMEAFHDYRKLLDEEEAALLNLKLRREESMRLNLLRMESTKSEFVRENEESITTTANNIPNPEKTPARLRFVHNESPRGTSESPTPKNLQLQQELNRRKNQKFRIRKGKTIETDGIMGFSGEVSFDSPNRMKADMSLFKDKEQPPKEVQKIYKEDRFLEEEPPKLGIWSLMEEIKQDIVKKKEAQKAESDGFDEGGSDSEGEEDDFSAEEMKKIQKNILTQGEKFHEVCRNDDYEFISPKKLKKSNTLTSKSVLKERPKVAKTMPVAKKQVDLSPKEKKTPEVREVMATKAVPRQSILTLQSAADKVTSRSMAALRRGEGQVRPVVKAKISIAPRELFIDADGDRATNVTQLKSQMSSFYLGSINGPKREGSMRNMASAQSTRKQANLLQGLKASEEEDGKKNHQEPSPEHNKKISLYEPAKVIHMSGHMTKQYQRLKTPTDSMSHIKGTGSSAIAGNNGRELEIAVGDAENFVSLNLDKGYKSTLALSKYRTPKAVSTADQDGLKELGFTNQYYKPKFFQPVLLAAENSEQDTSQAIGRSPSRGRVGFGSAMPSQQQTGVSQAQAQVYSSYKNDFGPLGLSPLKRDTKLPVSFEAYKKMLHSRRKTEDIRGRRTAGMK